MKRLIRIFSLCFVISFCSCLVVFFPTLSLPANAYQIDNSDSDLSSFLQFEQSVIALNNIEDTQSNSTNMFSISENEYPNNVANEFTDDFCLKRLIVQGDIKNNYNTNNVISYNNLHILCYSSKTATQYAFEQLSKDSSLNVIIDKPQKLEEYSEQNYDYTQYTNWGPEAIDIGGYRQFLMDNHVEKEIVVVVMDTGINTSHPMFSNRLLTDGEGKIKGFSYYNSKYQYSYDNLSFDVDNESTTDIDESDINKYSFEDDHSHGSHVAGIVCDLTPSNVKILPIKISGSNGYSSNSVFISAYLRVINIYSKQYTIACTNLSFSGAGKNSESEKETFNKQCYEPLMSRNILPITAAGNEYAENNIENLQAVVVSALKKQNNQYIFDNNYSNYGKIVDIAAPGTNIYSAGISETDSADSSIISKDGTSMASPQVAGVVALLYLNPNLPANFTAGDIEQMLYDNCLDMGSPNKDIYYGYGILNIKYFEIENTGETLSFYRDGNEVTQYIENENFENTFTLEIRCSNPEYDIIYSIDKSIPTLTNSTNYASSILVNKSIYIYAMGIKVENGQIVERTNLFNISYFNVTTPIEDCFTVSGRGYLDNYTGNYTHLTIPSTLRGRTITGLEPSLFKHSNLRSIILPDTLTIIAGYVFQYCDDLEYIYAPSVYKIYMAAFSYCNSLTKISDDHPSNTDSLGAFFPNLTTTVGFTFSGCKNLESINLSKLENVGDSKGYDFQACSNLKSVNLPAITSIPDGTFSLCESLTDTFFIGEFVNSIGSNPFAGCKIKSFSINEKNNNFYTDGLGVYSESSLIAFASGNENINYTILDSVSINEQKTDITTISNNAMDKAKINNLTIPSSITTINKYAFLDSQINVLYYNATNCLESGYFDKETFFIAQVFSNIETIEIGANVEQIPERLFQNVFFNNLIINSHSTIFTSACFYRMAKQGVLNKLTFNFTDQINNSYLSTFVNTSCIFVFNDVNYIYSKTEVPINAFSKFNKLKYSSRDGDYFIYSKEKLSAQYSINSSSNEFGQISPQGIIYANEGEYKTFTFIPNIGYHLASVLIDGVALTSTEVENASRNGYTFNNVVANHTISATFAINTYTIIASANSYGTITPNGNNLVNYGEDITFTFNANTGYHVKSIIVDNIALTGDDLTNAIEYGYTFNNVNANHTIGATFELCTYTITATTSANGTITPKGISNVLYGEGLDYTFTPDTGYKVKDVKVNNSSVGVVDSYSFSNVTSNQTISVEFEKIMLTINVICGDNGTINPSGEISVEYGTSKTFTIVPDENYEISDIELNGEKIGIKHSIAINNITENQTLKVVFAQIFLITSISDENGSITPSASISLGGQKRFDFFPNVGYRIKDVKIDNISIGVVSHYTFVNVDRSHTISVEYEIQKFNISLSVDGQGSLDADSALENISYGEDRMLTISAEEGWELFKLYINGRSVDVLNNQLLITDINEDMNIQAIFKEKEPASSLDSTTIAIIIGTTIISILLIALITKSYKNTNRRNLKDSMHNNLVPENRYNNCQTENYEKPYQMPTQTKPARPTPPNPMLKKAVEYVKGKEEHFISFCTENNIDYQNNYNNAVLRYYQAYLRSTKHTQPPKNDNN